MPRRHVHPCFELKEGARVCLEVFNILGESIVTLLEGELGPGTYSQAWNGRTAQGIEVASGVYLYRLSVGQSQETKKMVMLR